MKTQQIAIFGARGTGTTTIAANVAAALAEAGQRVVLIGCGSRADSTAILRGEKRLRTLAQALQSGNPRLEEVAAIGFKGILCLEAGATEGLAFEVALNLFKKMDILRGARPDVVLYDIQDEPTAVVSLLELGLIEQVFAVGTADAGALRTVNDLFRIVRERTGEGIRVPGIIGNNLPAPYAEAVIDDFARKTAVPVAAYVPRSLVVTRSEFFGETVIEAAPLSHLAYIYRKLARVITADLPITVPTALEEEDFRDWSLEWGERLYELDEGFVGGGAAI